MKFFKVNIFFREIERLGGLETESDYPYLQHKQSSCKLDKDKIVAYINGSVVLPKDEKKIMVYLAKNGPLSVGINATPLQFYNGGIHHPWKFFCNKDGMNHAVLLVGYGEEKGTPFWVVKNSWGTGWGEHGFFRLYRGDNTCGIAELVTSAVIN